jgi:CheY-like chemotaxis protein
MDRVLVVENDPKVQEILAESASRFGVAATLVDTVADALRAIERDPPDAILADIGMFHARELLGVGGTPVWVYAGVADDDTLELCVEAGVRGFWPKSIAAPHVMSSLRRELDRGHPRRATRSG